MKTPSKAMIKLVNDANEYFRVHKVKDHINSDLFWFVSQKLMDAKVYRGFNFFKMKTMEVNGVLESRPVLAGSSNPDEFEFIQFM